jgi:hypothetical protein
LEKDSVTTSGKHKTGVRIQKSDKKAVIYEFISALCSLISIRTLTDGFAEGSFLALMDGEKAEDCFAVF